MPGVYAFEVTVSDRQRLVSTAERIDFTVVSSGAVRPTIVARASSGGQSGRLLRTNLGAINLESRVTGNGPFRITWRQLSGPEVPIETSIQTFDPVAQTTPANAQLLPVIAGTSVYEVEAIDAGGVATRTTVTVVAEQPGTNRVPSVEIAPIGDVFVPVNASTTIGLSANGQDLDGDTLRYSWVQLSGPPATLGDGGTATGSSVSLTLRTPGVYRFEVYADDGQARSPKATLTFTAGAGGAVVASGGGGGGGGGGGCSVTTAPTPQSFGAILSSLLPLLALALLALAGRVRRRRED